MQERRCQVFVEKNDLLVETEGKYIRVEIVGSRDTELIHIMNFFPVNSSIKNLIDFRE